MARNIEILGLEKLKTALSAMPEEMRPYVLREISRGPAQKAVVEARRLQPIGETGQTARTIGILRVKNPRQTWVEVSYKGRSLGHIYTSAESITRRGRGTIKGFPSIFKEAGENIRSGAVIEMKKDLTKVFVRGMKKFGYR